MPRENIGWFEFNGITSIDKGIRIVDPPSYSSGLRRGSEEPVSGRNGYIWQSDETREQYDIKRTCQVRASRKRETQAWLSGKGMLRFSSEQDALYDARITKKIDFKMICPGEDPIYEFTVAFTVQPDPYIYPPLEASVFTVSGSELETPDYAYSLPRVEIHGSGDFSLTIGMETIFFTGIDGGVVIDSELMDALNLEGSQLINDQTSGNPYEIKPGNNTVSWLLGDGGNITKVIITPRWRYI